MGRRVGSYDLVEQIHDGGRFEYWLDRHGKHVVALVRPQYLYDVNLRVDVIQRLRERASIDHPNVPKLVEVVADPPAAVYRWIPGVSCRELLEHEPFPPEVAARIIASIARTIHEARIAPRWSSQAGLEPNNLLIDPSGGVHLLLSPYLDLPATVTGPGIIAGSILYLSPEAVRGLPQLPQSTVFSLGALWYELARGRHPFRSDDGMIHSLQRIMESTHDPLPDSELTQVMERALAKDPNERQLHAGELAAAIDRIVPRDPRPILEHALRHHPQLAELSIEMSDTEPVPPAEPDLLSAIAMDPDAVEPYLVYADWLQSKGDPRGELIVMQHQALPQATQLAWDLLGELRTSLDRPLKTTVRAFRAGPHWIGPLDRGPISVEWHLGFIKNVRILLGDSLIARLLSQLQQEESARFLRGMSVGPAQESRAIDHVYELFAGCRLSLESLFVGDLASVSPVTVHHATANVSAAFPMLKRLAIRGAEIHLGRLSLPELRDLRIYSGGLEAETLNEIASSTLPKLEHLELWFGGPPRRSAWPDRVSVVFDVERFPQLSSVAFADREPRALEATIAVLAESALAIKLQRIDLSESAISDTMIAMIDRMRFPQLVELRIPGASYSFSQNGRSGPTRTIG